VVDYSFWGVRRVMNELIIWAIIAFGSSDEEKAIRSSLRRARTLVVSSDELGAWGW